MATQTNPFGGIAEFEKSCRPLGLLLLPVDREHRNVNVIQQLVKELDCCTRRHEDHHLLAHILLQESEEQQEAHFGWAHNVALLQSLQKKNCECFQTKSPVWAGKEQTCTVAISVDEFPLTARKDMSVQIL